MINFTEGQLNLGPNNILAASDGELDALAEEGLVQKRKDNQGTYYYVEDDADGMRFGVTISVREKRTEWLLLRWLDRPMKGWDDVSETALKDEYHLLLNFVEKMVGRPFDNKGNRKRTWRFKWGQVEVSYEPRSFDAAIFIKPR